MRETKADYNEQADTGCERDQVLTIYNEQADTGCERDQGLTITSKLRWL